MNKNYTLISGYHREKHLGGRDTFFPIWMANILKLTPLPQQLIIICDSGSIPPMDDLPSAPPFKVTPLPLTGDLGNCHALLNGIKPHKFSGWTGAVLTGAMASYSNESHMIWYEQDVIHYGDIVGKMFDEIGDGGIIFGSTAGMPSAQSLFLVKHEFLPDFTQLFLSQGSQQMKENLGENIFFNLEQANPAMWKRFSFGYDRTRPVNYDDPVFYMQHISDSELEELRLRKMI